MRGEDSRFIGSVAMKRWHNNVLPVVRGGHRREAGRRRRVGYVKSGFLFPILTRPKWLRVFTYLLGIRYRDVIVLQGPPLMGVAFAMQGIWGYKLFDLCLLMVANLFLVSHIFSLNDWAGITSDLTDPNKAMDTFLSRGISKGEMGFLSLI